MIKKDICGNLVQGIIERSDIMKIALCVPTYNRADFIGKLLNEFVSYMIKHEVDLYIYDTSSNDETEEKVLAYAKIISKRIFYERVASDVLHKYHMLDESLIKTMYIFELFMGRQEYDYLWLCGDDIYIKEEVFDDLDLLQLEYSLISVDAFFLKYENAFKPYKTVEDYLIENTPSHAMLGGVLVNVKDLAKEKGFIKNLLNEYSGCPEEAWIYNIIYASIARNVSANRLISRACGGVMWRCEKLHSSWEDRLIITLTEKFYASFRAYPDEFNSITDRMINNMFEVNRGTMSKYYLCKFRAEGQFDIYTLNKYKSAMLILTDLPEEQLLQIANMEPSKAKEVYEHRIDTLLDFCSNHKKVMLYGAGYNARKCAEFFKNQSIQFDCFVVTDTEQNASNINGIPVISVDIVDLNNTGMILCCGEPGNSQVKKELIKKMDVKDIYAENIASLF